MGGVWVPPPGGTQSGPGPGTPPGGYPVRSRYPPQGGYLTGYPPGVLGTPPGGGPGTPPGGVWVPPQGGYLTGYPPGGGGTRSGGGGVPGQDNRRSTHYTAGGMPLAFTQEDFLVKEYIFSLILRKNTPVKNVKLFMCLLHDESIPKHPTN